MPQKRVIIKISLICVSLLVLVISLFTYISNNIGVNKVIYRDFKEHRESFEQIKDYCMDTEGILLVNAVDGELSVMCIIDSDERKLDYKSNEEILGQFENLMNNTGVNSITEYSEEGAWKIDFTYTSGDTERGIIYSETGVGKGQTDFELDNDWYYYIFRYE